MADNKKIYTIQINGIEQSIKQVDALKAILDALDARIKELESRNISIDAKNVNETSASSSNGGDNTSALREEDTLLKQIQKTEEKIAEVRRDEYQELLNQKEILKETKNESASRFAEDSLALKEYSNTMAGVKEHLADLKKAMQFKDLDSDEFKKMAAEANELNSKLKEAEESYGQFGRNVGNYANGVAEGLQKITIDVGGATREFSNAREASRELGMELKTMAANGQQGTKEFKELQKAVAKLNSDMKDATVSSQAMDNLLDTMQSFAAIGQVTQGFSALFGFDNDEIERSIQKLVALQNAMQGIEKIQQQINSQEGIGGWLAKGNSMIDSFVEKLVGAKKAQEELNAADKAGKVASEGLAAAETAQAAATSTATVATKALSLALKTIGIGLIISAVATLITYWKDIYKWFTDTVPALKNLGTWFGKIRAMAVGVGSAIVNYMVQPLATLVKVIKAVIQGNFSDIPKIIGEGVKKTFNVVENYQKGYNKETERQQQVHNKKMLKEQEEANEEWIKNEEAKNGKSLKLTKEYVEKQMDIINKQLANEDVGSDKYKELIKKRNELQRTLWSAEREEREKNNKKNADANKKALEEEKKQIEEARNAINSLTMRLMDEGLNKKLMQLDEEKRQTLAKLKQNSQSYLEVEKMYEQLRLKEVKDFLKDMSKAVDESRKKIEQQSFSVDISSIKAQINEIDQLLNKQKYDAPVVKTLVSNDDYIKLTQGISKERLKEAKEIYDHYREYSELEQANIEVQYKRELDIIRSYGLLEEGTLQESFTKRLRDQRKYQTESFENLRASLVDRRELLRTEATKEYENSSANTYNSYSAQTEDLTKQAIKIKDAMLAISKSYNGDLSKMTKEDKKSYDELQDNFTETLAQMQTLYANYEIERVTLKKNYDQKLVDIDIETAEKMSANQEQYFNTQISNYREFNSKLSKEISKQPIYDKAGFGIINLKETKKNYKEIQKAAEESLGNIKLDKQVLSVSFNKGLISPEAYNAVLTQLNDLEQSTKDNLKSVQENLKNLGTDFWGSINQWLQQVGQTMNTILSSLSEIQSNKYDEMISKQEEYIDEYSDLLDKQKDKTQEYADAVKNIEDELSTARGDRRQQLIDQLNAEMAAQRASLEQEKKIEKEKEKAEEKKKKLEHDQAVAKKKMQLAQAAINMAMAISMAGVNSWPIPAIPMMALAAAAGAAQIAAIASQNIPSYGSGGVIQGKSHAQGGVKVLGGQAEVEGGEYITNKVTTAKNVDLLEYINSKRKRINIDDLIEFYGGNSPVKKNIQTVRTKFADGGVVPTLRTDINLSDRLLTAFEDYSNRPTVVSVVDIIDRTQTVNEVKTMAGLEV